MIQFTCDDIKYQLWFQHARGIDIPENRGKYGKYKDYNPDNIIKEIAKRFAVDVDDLGVRWLEPVTDMTFALLVKREGEEKTLAGFGWAACSKSDNFCKKTGRAIALGRLIQSFPEWNDISMENSALYGRLKKIQKGRV